MYVCTLSNVTTPSTETMASSKPIFILLLLVHSFLLISHPVYCNDEEDNLFQGLNSHRQALNLPDLKKNNNAACLADELADELEESPCSSASDYTIEPGNGPKFPYFRKLIKKCHIDINTTQDGIIWPVCVPNLDADFVLKNYTHSRYVKYLNESKYTGAGVGSEEDWMIVVLTTDAHSGSFSGGAPSLGGIGTVRYMVASLLVLFLSLLC